MFSDGSAGQKPGLRKGDRCSGYRPRGGFNKALEVEGRCRLQNKVKKSYSIQAVDNALTVLEAFSEIDGEVRVSHLSETLGLNKSQVFRLLATLEGRGYVERGKNPVKYRLGPSAYDMGQKFLSCMGLLKMARPIMQRLARECNEAVYLAVRRNQDSLMLSMVDSTQMVNTVSLVGNSYPMSQTAVGKVLLAFEAEKNLKTVSSNLREELETIRKKGVAIDFGGVGDNTASLAVPIFNAQRKVSSGLCIVGPDFRLDEGRMEMELLPCLKEAGQIVSSQLGYLATHAV